MMKLVIFGASGGTGRLIVEQALDQGYDVTAFVRTPEKLELKHEKLNVVQGDVMQLNAVVQAVEGQDAVLCALGMPAMNKDKLRAKGTRNIIQAMKKTAVKRLICQSGLGISESRKILPLHYRAFILPLLLRYVFADHEVQEEYIKKSGLDWVIVRPANLTDKKRTGAYQHGFSKLAKSMTLKISRADVAAFMLKQLNENEYLHKTPAISY